MKNTQKIISRKEAIDQGLSSYFTGKPCKNGHVSERNTLSCACKECVRFGVKKHINKIKKIRKNVEEKF